MSLTSEGREQAVRRKIRFDRNELAGAFGDIGTDLPLIVGMIVAAHLDASSALVVFGSLQILTALFYRRPMPVQPLGNRRWPPALFVIALGQVPLSLGNSILATRQVAQDFFSVSSAQRPPYQPHLLHHEPDQSVLRRRPHLSRLRRLGWPLCVRSQIRRIGDALWLRVPRPGSVLRRSFEQVMQVFPLPVLGVLLLFEGLTIMLLVRDLTESKPALALAFLVGLMVIGLPYGYLIRLIVGTAVVYFGQTARWPIPLFSQRSSSPLRLCW